MSKPCHTAVELFRSNAPLFTALGDTHRQTILLLMSDGQPKCVKNIADHMQLSRPAVSHHIKILREARLLEETREGQKIFYTPVYRSHIAPLKELLAALEAIQ